MQGHMGSFFLDGVPAESLVMEIGLFRGVTGDGLREDGYIKDVAGCSFYHSRRYMCS